MKKVAQLESQYMKKVPPFGPGDTIRVHYKIKEGDKERIQVFQGTVISRRGSGTGQTFTVRKISSGVGVERVFPLHSPNIDRIERTTIGKVRRGKLYYLRELTGKSTRLKTRLTDKLEEKNRAAEAEVKARAGKAAPSTKIEEPEVEAEAAPAEETQHAPAEEGEEKTEAKAKKKTRAGKKRKKEKK